MKERWRITTPGRRDELVDLIHNKLVEFEKRAGKFVWTYPHQAVSEKIAIEVIVAEKGEPHLLKPDAQRLERMARTILKVHEEFDRDHKWHDGYDHERAAAHVAAAISRAETIR